MLYLFAPERQKKDKKKKYIIYLSIYLSVAISEYYIFKITKYWCLKKKKSVRLLCVYQIPIFEHIDISPQFHNRCISTKAGLIFWWNSQEQHILKACNISLHRVISSAIMLDHVLVAFLAFCLKKKKKNHLFSCLNLSVKRRVQSMN